MSKARLTRHPLGSVCWITTPSSSPAGQFLHRRQEGEGVLEAELGQPPHSVQVSARADEARDRLVHWDGLSESPKIPDEDKKKKKNTE